MIMRNEGKYDFSAFGQAVKEAQESKERLAQEVALAPVILCPLKTKDNIRAFRFSISLLPISHIGRPILFSRYQRGK